MGFQVTQNIWPGQVSKGVVEACQTSDLGQSMDEPIGKEEGTKAGAPT